MTIDHRLAEAVFATHGKHPWLDKAAIFCARELVILEAAALVYALASVQANIEGRTVRLWDLTGQVPLVVLLVICAWGSAVLLELIIKRPRPYTALKKKPLDHFWTPTPSMPSSHASIAFALALPTFMVGPEWVPVVFLFVAGTIAAARVFVGVHYASDVIVGALLGGVTAMGAGILMNMVSGLL